MSDSTVQMCVVCDRSGKESSVSMSLSEAGTFAQNRVARGEAGEAVMALLADQENAPDLLVTFRGKTVCFPTVVGNRDNAILRLLNALTNNDPQFPAPPVKTRKKKDSSGKSPAAAKPSKGGKKAAAAAN